MEKWVNECLPRIQSLQARELRSCLELTASSISRRRDFYSSKQFDNVYDRYCNKYLVLQLDLLLLEIDRNNPRGGGIVYLANTINLYDFTQSVEKRTVELRNELRQFPIQFTLPTPEDVRDPATSACCTIL